MSRKIKRELIRQLAKEKFSKKAWTFLLKKAGPKVAGKAGAAVAPNIVPGVGTFASVFVAAVLYAGDVYTVCNCGYMCSVGKWD